MSKRTATRKKIEGGLGEFFSHGFAKGWFFKVRDAFADQLDIASTSNGATMGGCFSFGLGDMFYDDARAYSLPWGEAQKFVRYAVCVEDAVPSSIITREGEDGKKTKYVADGALVFSIAKSGGVSLDFDAAQRFESDQYEFVQFLKTGTLKSGEKIILDLNA